MKMVIFKDVNTGAIESRKERGTHLRIDFRSEVNGGFVPFPKSTNISISDLFSSRFQCAPHVCADSLSPCSTAMQCNAFDVPRDCAIVGHILGIKFKAFVSTALRLIDNEHLI